MTEIPDGLGDRPPRGPAEVQQVIRQLGLRRREDLLVLSRNNDPYYQGTRAHRRDAEWFAGLWREYGYSRGVHIRRVHYRLVSGEGGTLPDGRPYLNDTRCYQYMNRAAMNARVLGLVDPDAFDDRRNEAPVINVEGRILDPEPEVLWDVAGQEYLEEDTSAVAWKVPELQVADFDPPSYALPKPTAGGYGYLPSTSPSCSRCGSRRPP
jgi:hypothetical protein